MIDDLNRLKQRITNKNGKLVPSYERHLSNDDIQLINSIYLEYTTLIDKCYSLINNGYKYCDICNR